MENFIKILIYIHAFFGGIGLLAGTVIMFAKKGNQLHVKAGKIFSVGMLVSTILSFIVCAFPNHHNSFLVLIGIFTIYLILLGNRVINYKKKDYQNSTDQYISGIMFLIGCLMVGVTFFSLFLYGKFNLLFLFFGVLSAFLAWRDFKFYKNPDNYKKWLFSHVGKMVGAYISSVTAFIVAGLGYGGNFYAWIIPTIIGTFYIIAWGRKLNKKPVL
jgi:uncharacterized membrane protein